MTSMIFAAVSCDADEPRPVKTAQAPESYFTMSHPQHDSAFILPAILVLALHF